MISVDQRLRKQSNRLAYSSRPQLMTSLLLIFTGVIFIFSIVFRTGFLQLPEHLENLVDHR